ncbi:hypothetical protein [Marinomonas sp. FW-1]|uniref:hypothetical protein n=1 Tax=Marinomonas sp. FW-1 TaxID=2071621 RepID=UPI0010C0D9D0|nr:hypothetical protein [Marinomonas sp. FW-1]
MTYDEMIRIAYVDWGDESPIAAACENIVKRIREGTPDSFSHLTFTSIHRISKLDLSRDQLICLVQYLSGERVPLFKVGFEYIGENESFILDSENSYYAKTEGAIAHPETGEVIENVKADVYMFFYISSRDRDE